MTGATDRKRLFADVKSVVVKVGSNVLTTGGRGLDTHAIGRLADEVHALRERGCEVVLVSSGAIAAGLSLLGIERRPHTLPELQATAAVGQSRLMAVYDQCFSRHGFRAAQVLLTYADLEDRTRYLNIRNTLRSLLRFGAVPVINENDTVAVDEIRFGDNDSLSSFVAHLLPADLLVLLSVVDGLLDKAGKVVQVVRRVTDEVAALADGSKSSRGTGGMESKLRAARYATEAGQLCVIANGTRPGVLASIMNGEPVGTLFVPSAARIRSRKRWLGFVKRPRGVLTVDEGARHALAERGKSLLASGVREVSGHFQQGDVVAVAGPDGRPFAQGMINYDSEQMARIKGLRTPDIRKLLGQFLYEEVIHRDNMVIIA
jgi:glutamate 5-kinase